MVALPTRYYVQTSHTGSTYGDPQGWMAQQVTFDRESAERLASALERAAVWEDGVNVTDRISTIARVVTAEELRSESEDALVIAEMQTRPQFWLRLEEWAQPLIDPRTTAS